MTTIILYGPQGSGKTTVAEKLSEVFGTDGIVDEWSPQDALLTDHLHVTQVDVDQLSHLFFRRDDNFKVVQIFEIETIKVLL